MPAEAELNQKVLKSLPGLSCDVSQSDQGTAQLLSQVKWEKGLYKMVAVRWLKHQCEISPGFV